MINITWGNLGDEIYMRSLGRLMAEPMGYDFAMRFALIGREIKKQQKLRAEVHESILKKYGTKDDARPGFYNVSEDKREAYAKEMEKLGDTEFTIKVNKFDPLAISEIVKLSPQDLIVLDGFFHPFELPGETTPLKPVEAAQPQPASH